MPTPAAAGTSLRWMNRARRRVRSGSWCQRRKRVACQGGLETPRVRQLHEKSGRPRESQLPRVASTAVRTAVKRSGPATKFRAGITRRRTRAPAGPCCNGRPIAHASARQSNPVLSAGVRERRRCESPAMMRTPTRRADSLRTPQRFAARRCVFQQCRASPLPSQRRQSSWHRQIFSEVPTRGAPLLSLGTRIDTVPSPNGQRRCT